MQTQSNKLCTSSQSYTHTTQTHLRHTHTSHTTQTHLRHPHTSHTQAHWQFVAVCCSVLQCVAVCCSVLQCVAVCCSVSDTLTHLTRTHTSRFSSVRECVRKKSREQKIHRMPHLPTSLSAKEPYDWWLFCRKKTLQCA